MYIGIMLAVILFFILAISIYLVKASIYPKTKEYKFTYNNEIDKGVFTKEYYESLDKEEIKIKSSYGYDINAIYFPFKNSKITAIIAHGFTYTLFGSIKYVRVFHKLGINALVYDQRYHGLSGGKNSTFGHEEKHDLKSVLDYTIEKYGDEMIIGTHGESLGGATVLLHGAMDDRVDFIISDCAFSDMKEEISHRLKEDNKLPVFPFVYIGSLFTKILVGGFYREVSPVSQADKIKCPTMIIHGKEDTYTPYKQGLDIYEKLQCSKHFYGAQGAKHAKSIIVDEDRYTQEVKIFLKQNAII